MGRWMSLPVAETLMVMKRVAMLRSKNELAVKDFMIYMIDYCEYRRERKV